jgi:hypothetical protein
VCFSPDRIVRSAMAQHHMTQEDILTMKKLGTLQLPSGDLVGVLDGITP